MSSKTIEYFGEAYNEGYKLKKNPDPNKYTQVVSTSANPYLPENYEEEQTRGKSEAYIRQFFKGSFNFSSNLVFPNFGTCIVEPHPLPRRFDDYGRRVLYFLIGVDYGIGDPTHVIFAAYSTEMRKLYVYDELRLNNSDVRTIAREYRKRIKINNTDLKGLLMMPRFDGRSYGKRESDLKTIGAMFEAEGLFFEPSFTSHEARIIKMNALINHNQMEVFSTCEFFIEEALNYKFKLNKDGTPTKKPEDKNDHGITACEFIVVELPHNLKELNLAAYIPPGTIHLHDRFIDQLETKKKEIIFDPLSKEVGNDRNRTAIVNNITYTGPASSMRAFSIYDDSTEDIEDTASMASLNAYTPR